MINWPDPLIRELSARRCLVFMGSGASAGCLGQDGRTRPPDWKDFLLSLQRKMQDSREKRIAEDMINEKRFLEAAEIIRAGVSQPDFTQFIRDTFVVPKFAASAVHNAVLQIDPKVTITTNYDDIYDTFCRSGDAADGYNVARYYESHLVSDLRSPVRVIVKAHGCISDPARIVLTRSQYFLQKRDHGRFFRVLDALFLSSSILFIGYSLSDPDIQLVLENAAIAAPESHPHYAVIGDDVHPALKLSWSKAYNIQFLVFPAGDYDYLNRSLAKLAEDVIAYRETHSA